MARPDKASAVEELKDGFTSSAAVVLTEYRGLTVKALLQLRRALGADATYAVAKNTLTAIAAKEAGIGSLRLPELRRRPIRTAGTHRCPFRAFHRTPVSHSEFHGQ